MSAGASALVVNGETFYTRISANDLISAEPRGAYTTARTFNRHSVFELDAHVERLSTSALLMLRQQKAQGSLRPPPSDPSTPSSSTARAGIEEEFAHLQQVLVPSSLHPLLLSVFRAGVAACERAGIGVEEEPTAVVPAVSDAATSAAAAVSVPRNRAVSMNLGEYRLSALLTWDGAAADALRSLHASLSAELDAAEPIAQATTVSTTIPAASAREALYRIAASLKTPAPYMLMCHASPLPRRRKPPIAVLVAGKPRSNALAKDSEWIRQRLSLEAAKGPNVEEVLLSDESGRLFEGTQTNFFAIQNGTVYTAGEGVLEGTVRRLVLETCMAHGIPVILQPPNLSEIRNWDGGAFISSTSRLVMPIDAIQFTNASSGRLQEHQFPPSLRQPSSLLSRLEGWVESAVASHSTSLGLEAS